jgi:hypothetical protein
VAIEFKGSNAVFLPPPDPNLLFNPALFSQVWMIQNLHVEANDFINEGAAQVPFLFNQRTRRFGLLVMPERIQLSLFAQEDGEGEMVTRVMLETIRQFPQDFYHAVGLNFNWMVNWNGHQNPETSRRLFDTRQNHPFFREFNTDDSCFGAYASKTFFGVRLRVDAKPVVTGRSDEINTSGILFNFNFHQELTGEHRAEDARRLLGLWEQARNESRRIVQQINTEFDL